MKPSRLVLKSTTIAAALGNMLEFYNFTLFSLFLPILLPVFFPADSYFASLLLGYLVLAVGFLAYPFGSLLFGYIGDKYGRKRALLLSISLMAIATSLIGVIPSYQQLGYLSPLALSLCRIIQGICAGGESIGAGILVVEHANKNSNVSFLGSIPAAFGTVGALLASIVVYLLTKYHLTSEWWRYPFIATLVLGLIVFYFRKTMSESPLFIQKVGSLKEFNRNNDVSVRAIFKKTPFSLLAAAAVGAFGTVPFYLIIGFLNIYLGDIGIITPEERVTLNLILLTFCALTLPLAGYIAGKVGYFQSMITSSLTTLIYAYFFFKTIFIGNFSSVLYAELFLLAISQFYVAPINAFISKLFPTSLRYKGAALGYCIGMALFGGTAPYISTLLIKWSSNNATPFLYLILVSFIGMVGVILGQKLINETKVSIN
jgi:MHS family proline/betaine transporter-like MFS transporter